ncbi:MULTISPECIES: DUF1329 domain-containing protein [Pseudomonas]|jgi:hypothetical protein|uniref:DUF1329 domain-containing protein n=1 Tax=Pseudomonas lurida TaxID=244566 RepID=A0ABY9FP70_9PSED|nr:MULTISPECIES: DUF1329 domain-containing protein [Pseudomonas]QDH66533.1 DUF1329 domain-containing protein [Pseudomonas azotoformans]WLG54870.1 DUF1329 domain-containing protein [Pseudomonas extremorientalis]WLH05106.1 DUF1329 domain-containing protein [Pseudomonas lurida]
MTQVKYLLSVALGCVIAAPAFSAPTADETSQIGKSLTEFGATIAANADGSIPAYDPAKALNKAPAGYAPIDPKGGFPYVDPYAGEKPILTITAKNMDQYLDKLDDGNKSLLARYPEYRIDVYPTHRSAPPLPKWARDNTLNNIGKPRLEGDGTGLADAHAQVPFPIPKTGSEAMWNFNTRFFRPYETGNFVTYLIDSAGQKTLVTDSSVYYEHEYWDNSKTSSEFSNRLLNVNNAPAAKSGSKDMRFSPLRMDEKADSAWSYSPGQRRVRLAPEFKYDTVAAQYGGLITFDEINGFDGKMDRFDFKLVGKKEMYIPYNSYRTSGAATDDLVRSGYANPDLMRWELHRVWVVEATLKPGQRHANPRKMFYLDEDSWSMAVYNSYDAAGKLHRSQNFASFVAYDDVPMIRSESVVMYDHSKGNYALASMSGGTRTGWHAAEPFSPNLLSSAAMAGAGIR